ncbi:MAG: hypothetical protein QOJ64_3020 [Acidobacteriota bacterium]|jgi:hypothetical protein|nr:hypothetical protein [Acidobacteriota bacterium]
MLNLKKHVAGFILFSTILVSSVVSCHYLTLPIVRLPAVPLGPLVAGPVESTHISYRVREVSIDFNRSTNYTVLSLKLLPGHPPPEKLWITTFYFSPEIYRTHGDMWSTTEFRQPFANANEIELVATDSLNSGKHLGGYKVGYFAHVSVWTGDTENSYPPNLPINRDIANAEPVVVHWPDENLPTGP